MERRKFLTGVGAALLPAVGGCVARPPAASSPATASGNRSGTDARATGTEVDTRNDGTPTDARDDGTESTAAGESPSLPDSNGPVRGESDAVVETRSVEDDEDVEYVPEDDAVRYVAAWRHTNREEVENGEPPEREPVYETTPFERWGKTNCLMAAARAAADHASAELGVDDIGGGISSDIEGRDLAAVVSVSTVLDRDGNVVSETPVEFDALVTAAPATVDATYVLGDRKYSVDAPIFASYDVLQQE